MAVWSHFECTVCFFHSVPPSAGALHVHLARKAVAVPHVLWILLYQGGQQKDPRSLILGEEETMIEWDYVNWKLPMYGVGIGMDGLKGYSCKQWIWGFELLRKTRSFGVAGSIWRLKTKLCCYEILLVCISLEIRKLQKYVSFCRLQIELLRLNVYVCNM